MPGYVPNPFHSDQDAKIPEGEDKVMLRIKGVLTKLLVHLVPAMYGPCMYWRRGARFCALKCFMLMTALLWLHFRGDLESRM
jgi:hypothetical protein